MAAPTKSSFKKNIHSGFPQRVTAYTEHGLLFAGKASKALWKIQAVSASNIVDTQLLFCKKKNLFKPNLRGSSLRTRSFPLINQSKQTKQAASTDEPAAGSHSDRATEFEPDPYLCSSRPLPVGACEFACMYSSMCSEVPLYSTWTVLVSSSLSSINRGKWNTFVSRPLHGERGGGKIDVFN